MAERRPLVSIDGRTKMLPLGDTLPGGGMLYPKKSVHTTSGTFFLPETALPAVRVLLVGGGGGTLSAPAGSNGGDTTIEDATSTVIAIAEGARHRVPGRGGGVGATATTVPTTPATAGLLGWACGGRCGSPIQSSGPGAPPATDGEPGTGGGAGGAAASNSAAGAGGGVTIETVALVPGDTYTHTIGAGGAAPTGGWAGGSGRVEYHYMDTVP